ncbi:MAG: pyridoxine 5'-phosphate synthase [Thermodesulfovibrionales bacterium]|nr:pyridoxine 5'-phosphate synthase [Thermodesulfovibrionales bacterium]
MLLCVNIDHVATLRQARRGIEPDPVMVATLAILGGADGITVHLREDRRHIQDRDLKILREVVPNELNLEMAATKEMIGIAIRTKPDLVTLVPEKRLELTTEGGLEVKSHKKTLQEAIRRIHGIGIPVSLFINPQKDALEIAKQTGADMVEIHTGMYADAKSRNKEKELTRVVSAVKTALDLEFFVNAGHGLNYFNVSQVASIQGIRGLYIGHSIISRAVFIGMERAVREMNKLIKEALRE